MDTPSPASLESSFHQFPTNDGSRSTRACDACRRRKIKCVRQGTRSCVRCRDSLLHCSWNDPVQKKGPKPRLSLRGITSAPPDDLPAPLTFRPVDQESELSLDSLSTAQLRFVPTAMIGTCVNYYFERIHPLMPIVDHEYVQEMIREMTTSYEAYCLVHSLCAYTTLVSMDATSPTLAQTDHDQEVNIRALLDCVRDARMAYNSVMAATLPAILTAAFLYCAYERINDTKLAWYYLREATTLVYTANMHERKHYEGIEPAHHSRDRSLFWFLFVAERTHALRDHRPVTLHATIDLPATHNCVLDERELSGHLQLIELFRLFDVTFLSAWTGSGDAISADSVAQIQQQITAASPAAASVQASQTARLLCSQAWLHVTVWQLALTHGLLSSNAIDPTLSFTYPLTVADQLVNALEHLPIEAMRIHGASVTAMIFEVACCLVDVARCTMQSDGMQHLEVVNPLLDMMAKLPGGLHRYVPIVVTKLSEDCGFVPSWTLSSSLATPNFDPYLSSATSPSTTSQFSGSEPTIEGSEADELDYFTIPA